MGAGRGTETEMRARPTTTSGCTRWRYARGTRRTVPNWRGTSVRARAPVAGDMRSPRKAAAASAGTSTRSKARVCAFVCACVSVCVCARA